MFCEPCQASMVTVAPIDRKKKPNPVHIPFMFPMRYQQTHRLISTCTECGRKEDLGTIEYTFDESELPR